MTQQKNPMTQIWAMTYRLGTTALEHNCKVMFNI